MIRRAFKQIYLPERFFYLFGSAGLLFVVGYLAPAVFPVAKGVFALACLLLLTDLFLLFGRVNKLRVARKLPKVMTLGDPNAIALELENGSRFPLRLSLVEELPEQFQIRDFEKNIYIKAGESRKLQYELTPVTRGAYMFGVTQVFVATSLGLLQRRQPFGAPQEAPVYPSILQMKEYELRAFNRLAVHPGIKKIRRIGHTFEFEQIKQYVTGDDYRSINWKATGRRNDLMVNQYEDERAQQVYCLIDKSRAMRMPFNGMSLMDYAINTTLVLSNIILKKHDKAGLLTFSDKLGSVLKAERKPQQLPLILQSLYKEKERVQEASFELLYHACRQLIRGRSLLILFTNFESVFALERALPELRRIASRHLLVVVFFENQELRELAYAPATDLEGIYKQAVAQKFVLEKAQMVQILRQYGIQAVLTRPEDLSLATINKYLELKARGWI